MGEKHTAAIASAGAHTLKHVNAAPAQTWNWLRINETTFDVELPRDVAAAVSGGAELASYLDQDIPEEARNMLMGAGTQASAYLDAAATKRQVIEVPAETELAEPILVELDGAAALQQTTVICGADSAAHVVVSALGSTKAALTTGHILRVIVRDGAAVKVSVVVAQDESNRHIDSLGVLLGEDATLELEQYVLGSGQAALGVGVELQGRKAELDATVRYVARHEQVTDINYFVRHLGGKTTTNIDAAGVLSNTASKTMRATIDLVRGCKGAEGTEIETVVLAGDEVRNKTLPIILCSEDDVAGNHGATIGSLSEEQLFYLACRGLAEADATGLMQGAIVDDAAARLSGTASDQVVAWAERTLGHEAATQAAIAAELARAEDGDDERE